MSYPRKFDMWPLARRAIQDFYFFLRPGSIQVDLFCTMKSVQLSGVSFTVANLKSVFGTRKFLEVFRTQRQRSQLESQDGLIFPFSAMKFFSSFSFSSFHSWLCITESSPVRRLTQSNRYKFSPYFCRQQVSKEQQCAPFIVLAYFM